MVQTYYKLSQQSELLRRRLSLPDYYETSSPTSQTSHSAYAIHPSYTATTPTFPCIDQQSWPPPESSEPPAERTLYELNHQIKTTLTELLNCDFVKHDKLFRAWVQGRLMDAEHELKRQRRWRNSFASNESTMRSFNEQHHFGSTQALASWKVDI